ncbi:MAG: guanine deaminase [Pseudomonadota bacterium]|jgi:guanine deaminase
MKAWRASLLWFDGSAEPARSARYEADGLLLTDAGPDGVERVLEVGAYQSLYLRLRDQQPGLTITELPGRIIAPGFVDMHIHYPQVDVMGSPADGLLPWLENYTFPEEKKFFSDSHCANVATFFVAELLRHGVTTAMCFASAHVASVQALFAQSLASRLRVISGLCLMDRHAPEGLRNDTEQSLVDTEALIEQWHGKGRLGYAITPRFAPSCTPRQLQGAGELATRYPDVWVQSHVAENLDEIRWARELFPASGSYLGTYADFGLLRQRAVYAHCIHFDDADRALMSQSGAAAAVCPTSNLFLGSGFFDFALASAAGMQYGLASDVGGGTSFSPFHTMLAAYYVGRQALPGTPGRAGVSLSPQELWWQHTAGAAAALGLAGVVGNLLPGCDADFVVLNPQATPLLASRTGQARSLDELLFALIVLGDDRVVDRTVVA